MTTQALEGLAAAGRAGDRDAVSAPPSRWRTRVLLPGVLLAIVAALLVITAWEVILPATDVRVVPVVVRAVEGRAGAVTVQATGWLEPDPHPVFVAALASGVVREVLVLEGDRVEAGDVVATLVDDDARLALARAAAELEASLAEVDVAKADRDAAKLALEEPVERTRALAVARARLAEAGAELESVRADVAVERARLAEIRDEFDRKSTLTDSQAVSVASVARLGLRVEAQAAVVAATIAREAVLEARRREAEAEQDAATRHLELLVEERRAAAATEAAVRAAGAAVDLATAARDEAALRLERMRVRAPAGGIVMRRLVAPGSARMTDGQDEYASHIVHLYDPARLQVRADVPLADAALVTVGQRAEITVEVLRDHVFVGRVTRVVHEADIQKNTVEVKVAIEDPGDALKPEMLARVRFLGSAPAEDAATVRQRVFAPRSLIVAHDGGESALVVGRVVDGRGWAERRPVTLGAARVDGWVEVERGLQVGDLLIADPVGGVDDGSRVRVVGEAREHGDGR